ncbi:MAG: hypothetical protein HZB91_01940 [Elusimicrobia bacterium]|nr:hypothetical protein [Elusimicrobiota bacterium]
MEQDRLLKLAEERFMEFSDKVQAMQARAEDLNFRGQRWANSIKNRTTYRDAMFPDDLQLLRRHVRSFGQDASALPGLVEWLERESCYSKDPRTFEKARSLLKVATQFEKDLAGLCDQLRHLHHCTPETDLKVEVWYMVQDIEVLHDKCKGYPFLISSRIMLRISSPDKDAPPENGAQPNGPPA